MPRPSVVLLILALWVCPNISLVHAQQSDTSLQAPSVHVAFVEGGATIEREGVVEPVEPGLPLLDGDRLESSAGRLELLFDDGSTLYVDEFSRLDVLSSRFLRLVTGRVTFEVSTGSGFPGSTLYEFDTPAASVALKSSGEYRILTQQDRFLAPGVPGAVDPTVTIVEVVRGTATLTSDTGRTDLRAGEQSVVRNGEPPGLPGRFNSAQWTPFGHWIELRRSERRDVSASRQYLPPDVQPYATEFDRYGTWSVEAGVGPVWYPTVGGGWRPYHNGRWTWISQFGWTWVGHDAWSWPTHHYGRWGLNTRGSWYWIPGRQWGPGWVSWAIGSTFVSWCPLGFNGQPVIGFSTTPSYVYNRVFDPDFAWTTIPGHAFGTNTVAGRIAIAGRRFVDRHHEPFILQHGSPPRPHRGTSRFSSRRDGPEFTSRRFGPGRGTPGVRNRGGSSRVGDPGRVEVAPPARFAVPRSTISMPAPSLSPAGDRFPAPTRPVITPQGAYAPGSQVNGGRSPILPMPGPGLPQTRYGIPPGLPPVIPGSTVNTPHAVPRQPPQAASADQSAPTRTAVPRSGSGSTAGSSRSAIPAGTSSGTAAATSRARSR